MADKFDAYREALVVEDQTVWPEEFEDLAPQRRKQIEERLHADARQVSELEYVRLPAGFCRRITVTADDLERVS